MKNIITTENAPAPVGPYSQAVEAGPFLFCSGQISLTPGGKLLTSSIEEQTRQIMINVGEVLKAAGLNYSDVVKTMIFLTDMADFQIMNQIYSEYFPENPPARSCVAAHQLPKGVNVEIEVLALRK